MQLDPHALWAKRFLKGLRIFDQFPALLFSFKWLIISLVVGSLIGTASAWFLIGLHWATEWRIAHDWIIWLLPIGGLLIGLSYHYMGKTVVKGNNQLLEEIINPKKIIPLKMAPLVTIGTIATHFFGGSAGREGTAVQVGGAIADQFTKVFKLSEFDRKMIIIAGISGGFASVFGTPLAGAVFGLEVYVIGRMKYDAILPSFLTAVIADFTCRLWQVGHTHYEIPLVPEITVTNLIYAIIAGIAFGLAGMAFAKATHAWGNLFSKTFKYPPLRPFVGGILIALGFYLVGHHRYAGLGVPEIVNAFEEPVAWYDFIGKIFFTSLTLGSGFKGGEVTPLFYTGATLGNSLAYLIPLPMALLAGMGFVGVFSGATNTPIACTLMGIELFGIEAGIFLGIACVVAYTFSGHSSIYSAQMLGSPKHKLYGTEKGKTLAEINALRKEQRERYLKRLKK